MHTRLGSLRTAPLLSMTIFIAAVAVGCNAASAPALPGGMAAAEWMQANGNDQNTRDADSQINSGNVSSLNVTWTQPLTGTGAFGAFASMPLISKDGVTYVQDLASNVMAYDLKTGKQLWRVDYNAPTVGPNGLAFEDGVLFGVTTTDVFAIDAESGHEIWKKHVVDEPSGVAAGQSIGLTIQPAVRNGVVHLSEAATAGGGLVFAFDAKTGAQLWSFDTTTAPKSDSTPAGGAWNTPLIDADGNVYYAIGNGYYTPNSPKSTQGQRLYTDSLVKLDGRTGKLLWFYQAIPNDFWDHDLQLSPMLADNGGQELVVTGGKLGYVIAVDPNTGAQVWKTAVGGHNGHDNDGREQLDGTLALPTPPFEVLPGPYGGIETNLAVHDGKVYAAVVDLPALVKTPADLNKSVGNVDFATGKGELVRLDLATGAVDWSVKLDSMPFGAATVSDDLVFTTLYDGRVVAYSIKDGSPVWSATLPAGTNSPLAIAGDRLVTAAGFPQGPNQKAALVVFQLNGEPVTPPSPPPGSPGPSASQGPPASQTSPVSP
jgi:outer membrane protein assembly factor BamB